MADKGFENKEREGALFKVKEKRTDRSPDYTGKLRIEGEDYLLSAWITKSLKGVVYMRLAASTQEEIDKRTSGRGRAKTAGRDDRRDSGAGAEMDDRRDSGAGAEMDEEEDDIPF